MLRNSEGMWFKKLKVSQSLVSKTQNEAWCIKRLIYVNMVWKENFSFSWPDSIPILIITKEIEHREKFERLERRRGKKFFINDFEVTLEFQEQSQRLMWAANQSLTLLTQTELKEILDIR